MMRCFSGSPRLKSELGLDAEWLRVLDRYHTAFVRNGGGLAEATKKRLAEINERLATLGWPKRSRR